MQETQNVQDAQKIQSDTPPVPQDNYYEMTPQEKHAESLKVRLSKARREAEEESKRADKLADELKDLKKKFDSGKATTNESQDYVSSKHVLDQAKVQGIHPDEFPELFRQHMQELDLRQKIEVATEKDPELKSLMEAPDAQQKISTDELRAMKHLDNPLAVFKHLLKNEGDRMVLKAAEQLYADGDRGVAFFTFLNNLSEKLKKTSSYPHPSQFSPPVDLSDVGESEEFDSTSYIKSKYG